MTTQVVWFKRDLRLHDHAPLAQAAAHGPVVALHITEPSLLASDLFDASHAQFIDQSLADLAQALAARGGCLVRRWGEALQVLDALHGATRFTHLWSHEEIGQRLTWDRDRAVLAWCRARGVVWTELPQCGVFRPLHSRNGWAARWDRRMATSPIGAPPRIQAAAGVPAQYAPPGLRPRHGTPKPLAQPGGERAGSALLQSFLQARGVDYRRGMSSPLSAAHACSRLSPHLAWGTVSLRTMHHAADARAAELKQLQADGAPIDPRWPGAVASFQGRLRWHCHFMQKLEDAPRIEFQNFARVCDGLRPDVGDPGWRADWFHAWCDGRTGYPMVDACMRALHASGWINFRMRAMLVSFAAYHLWLHWRQPALFLARQFVDFEPGIHFSQCQMQSGTTGINTLRIYSPTELARVPAGFVHEPWRMPGGLQQTTGCRIAGDGAGSYPPPLVDHASAWRAARERFTAVRNSPAARQEADAIQQRHGSRRSGMRMTGQGPRRRAAHAAASATPPAQLSLFDSLPDGG